MSDLYRSTLADTWQASSFAEQRFLTVFDEVLYVTTLTEANGYRTTVTDTAGYRTTVKEV